MKRKKNWLCIALTVLTFTAFSITAYGGDGSDEDVTLSPYFYVQGAEVGVDAFPLKDTKVQANINGVIADTYVTQTYTNEGTKPINARYMFPASTRVSVHGMKMEIGDQVVIAKIKEKKEAKQEFEAAKSEGKSASLLEEQRPNVFTMDIANVMPGDTVRIELHYTELITSTDGIYQFVFPTVVGPRYPSPQSGEDAESNTNSGSDANRGSGTNTDSGSDANRGSDANQQIATPYLPQGSTPADGYDITVNVSAGVPISDLQCKSHETNVTWEGTQTAQVSLANSADYAGNRDYILEYILTGKAIDSGLMLYSGKEENFFTLMVQPPERYSPKEITHREYIFVIDVSGSMYGFPLDTSKELIKNLVGNLRSTDRFNVILFSGASELMSPQSVPATAENIQMALKLIEEQNGGGGTELGSALGKAIAIPANPNFARSIVVITDGYISSEKAIFELINKNLNKSNFFAFGIGSGVNRYLIEGIAKAGLGEAFVVTDDSEAADTAERFRTYVEAPLLTDIQITYDGFDVYDVEPANVPTLFAQKPIVIYGKWRDEPAGTIKITGKTGTKDYIQEIPVTEVIPSENNTALSYLWARARVEKLTDYGLNDADTDAAKKEVTEIGLKYSMMTPYTSFIAVLETVRNRDKQSTDVSQPSVLPENVSDLAVGGYAVNSEPEQMTLIAIILLILFTGIHYQVGKKRNRQQS